MYLSNQPVDIVFRDENPRELSRPHAAPKVLAVAPSPRDPLRDADLAPPEWNAVRVGIMDGERARKRSVIKNFYMFVAGAKPQRLADPRLEALRRYAELAGALHRSDVATTSLMASGLSRGQVKTVATYVRTRIDFDQA